MSKKPVGWRNESYRHSLASRGIGKKAVMYGHHYMETLLHPRTYESVFVHRDLRLFINDKAYEALDRSGWSSEDAYDLLNSELEDLKMEYALSKDENTKLQIDVIQQAKADVIKGDHIKWLRDKWPAKREETIEKYYGDQMESSGRPIVLDIKGKGSFDGDLRISLEGAEELLPLLQSRGVRMQALSAFNSTSGTQKIEGRIEGVDVDLKVTHPGEDLYHVEGDMYYHIDRTFTRKELKGFYEKAKRLM